MNNCTLCKNVKPLKVNFKGAKEASLIFIGDSPSLDDYTYGEPFSGKYFILLQKLLKDTGFKVSDCYFTHMYKCLPQENFSSEVRSISKGEYKTCKQNLLNELKELTNKKIVVLLGNSVLYGLTGKTGITKFRGAVSYSEELGCSVFPMISPSTLLQDLKYQNIIKEDFKALYNLYSGGTSQTKEPTKYFKVDTLDKFNKVIARLNEVESFSMDLETTGLKPKEDHIICFSFSWAERTGVYIPILKQKAVPEKDTPKELLNVITEEDRFWGKDHEYIISELKKVVSNNALKIMHNGKFDGKFIKAMGVEVNNFNFDTMLAHYLLDENARGMHDLKTLATLFTDMGAYEQGRDDFFKNNPHVKDMYIYLPEEMIFTYGCSDTDCTLRCYNLFKPRLTKEDLDKVFYKLIMPLSHLLKDSEYLGFLVDREQLKQNKIELTKEQEALINDIVAEVIKVNFTKENIVAVLKKSIEETTKSQTNILWLKDTIKYSEIANWLLEQPVRVKEVITTELTNYILTKSLDIKPRQSALLIKYIGIVSESLCSINLNSPAQLKDLLFNKLKLISVKETETGSESTDEEALVQLAEQHPIPKSVLGYRRATKLLSTYVIGLEEKLDPWGRVHPSLLIHGTNHGRLSCKDPNLQQIPRAGKDDRIKKQFIVPEGYMLIEADYGQAEFRMLAHYCQDTQMLKDLKKGFDIHKLIAAVSKGIRIHADVSLEQYQELIKDVTKQERQNAKTLVFGLIYGQGVASIASDLKISEREGQNIINQFFGRYPGSKKWIDNTKTTIFKTLQIRSIFGRIRRLPNVLSSDKQLQSEALRQVINAPIASAASDMNCYAAIRIMRRFKKEGLKGELLILIHDSEMYEVPKEEFEQSLRIIKEEMERPVCNIEVPMIVDIKAGVRWSDLQEVKIKQDGTLEWVKKEEKVESNKS